METANLIAVEVVLAMPEQQRLVRLTLAAGSSVSDAIEAAALHQSFPDIDYQEWPVAIWGETAGRSDRLRSGDRVELLRPLAADPRDARRLLAESGSSMSDPRDSETSR